MSFKNTIIAGGIAAAIVLGGVAAVPALAEEVTGQPQPQADGGQFLQHRQERREARREALAAELGVSVDDLKAAASAAHETVLADLGPVGEDPTPEELEARADAFRAAFAGELGISVEDLHAAARNVLEDRLATGVETGRITQEQADEMLAAFDDGTLREYIRDHVEQRFPNLHDRLQERFPNLADRLGSH